MVSGWVKCEQIWTPTLQPLHLTYRRNKYLLASFFIDIFIRGTDLFRNYVVSAL